MKKIIFAIIAVLASVLVVGTNQAEILINNRPIDLSTSETINHFVSGDGSEWKVIKKDYLTKYIDFNFVYINDSVYGVNWKWNDNFIRESLESCEDFECVDQLYKIHKPSKLIDNIIKNNPTPVEDILNSASMVISMPISQKASSQEQEIVQKLTQNRYTPVVAPEFQLEEFARTYFDGEDMPNLMNYISSIKQHGMPRNVLKNKAVFHGDFYPFSTNSGSFLVELPNGVESSNGLQLKFGINSTIFEFSNEQSSEELTFTEAGQYVRYIKIPKASNVSFASFDVQGKVYNNSGGQEAGVCTDTDTNTTYGPNPLSGTARAYVPSGCDASPPCTGGDECYCTGCNYSTGSYSSSMTVCAESGWYVNACSTCGYSAPPFEWFDFPAGPVGGCTGDSRSWSGTYGSSTEMYATHGGGDAHITSVSTTVSLSYFGYKTWGWYPDNINISLNGSTIFYYSQDLQGTANISDFADLLNAYLIACTPDGNGDCLVPINFSVQSKGILKYLNINITHRNPPKFDINTADDSNLTSPTKIGNNVSFTATISDGDNDTVNFFICDESGRTGIQCVETEFCSIVFELPGQKSCQFNTTGLTGIEYNWTSFACDNTSYCTNGANGTFYILRPTNPRMYVNGSSVWNYTGLFNGPITVENFTSQMQTELDGCQSVNDSCNISLMFSSDSAGVLELSLIDIQYLIYDTTLPVINQITVTPNPVPANSPMNITVNATDNANVTLVTASHAEASVNLTYYPATGLWKGSMTSPSKVGIYQFNITAIDSSNLTTINASVTTGTSNSSGSCTGYCTSGSGSGKAELIIYSTDIFYSPNAPENGNNLSINATVYNLGEVAANNFKVELKIDSVHQTYNTISLSNGSNTITQFYWNATAGNHTIEIKADYTSIITEDDETNNNGNISISVIDVTPPSILSILTERGSLIMKLNITDNFNISSVIAVVNTTTIVFSYNSTSKLWEGYSATINPGTYATTIIVVDGSGLTTTLQTTIIVYSDSLDMAIATGDLTFSNPTPVNGDNITINVNVHNYGKNQTINFAVELLVDNVSIKNNTLSVLGDSNSSTSFNWITTYGNHTITAKIDSNSSIAELNESNNLISRTISVKDGQSPVINMLILPNIVYETQVFSIKVNASDNVNISNVTAILNSSLIVLSYNSSSGLYENTITAISDGEYLLEINATDVNQLYTSLKEKIIIYDTQADLTTALEDVTLLPDNVTENNQLTINASISNNGGTDTNNVRIELLIDGTSQANKTLSIQKASTNLTQFTWNTTYGYHNLSISIDPSNTIAESNESNNQRNRTFFVLDVTPPPKVSLTASPSNWSTQPTHTISWTAVSDANGISRYEYKIDDNNWINVGLNTSFTTPTQEHGIHLIAVRATDNPGNIGNESNVSIYIDTTPPNTPVILEWKIEENWSYHASPYLTWNNPGDDGSGITKFKISIDDAPEIDLGFNLSYSSSNLSTGNHTFKVKAYDAVNYSSNWSSTLTVYIDTIAPAAINITSSTHPINTSWYAINMPVFNFSVPSDNSGIYRYYYLVDQVQNSTPNFMSLSTSNTTINITDISLPTVTTSNITNATTATGLSDGTWYFHVIAVDNSGNIGVNVSHYKFNIDASGPDVLDYSPANNSNIINRTPKISVSFIDYGAGINISSIVFKVDGSDVTINSTINETNLIYNVNSALILGEHNAVILLKDNISNTLNFSWTFTVVENGSIDVSNLTLVNSSLLTSIFEFKIKNNGSVSLGRLNWSLNTGETTIYANQLFSLTAGETILVYVEYNYSSPGNYTITASATDGVSLDSESIQISLPNIDASSLQLIRSDGLHALFSFVATNQLPTTISNLNWSFNTGENIIRADKLTSITSGETVLYYIEYNYTTPGTYAINVTVTNGTYSDSENMLITISPIYLSDLSVLYAASLNRTFGFKVTNDWSSNIINLNWTFNTGESIIAATQLTSIASNEMVLYYVDYIYSSTGNYTVNVTATNLTYSDSEQMQITVP